MNEEVDVETVTLQQHAHRVDEERHVVGDHQHDRMGGRPTIALAVRRHHPDDGRTGRTPPPEVEVGGADRVDVVDLAVVDVLFGQLGVVQRKELSEQFVVRATDGGKLAKAIERLGHVGMGLHGQPPAPTTLSERLRRPEQ